MRRSRSWLGLVLLAACNQAAPSAPPTQRTTASVSSRGDAPTPPAVPHDPPLFTYREGTDELAFWPPTTLRLIRNGAKTCMSELSNGGDNMWTGPDMERAIADADVRHVLVRGKTRSFLPEPDDGGTYPEGRFETDDGVLEWKHRPCRWCEVPPAGISSLHRVLTGVMMNRRLLCP